MLLEVYFPLTFVTCCNCGRSDQELLCLVQSSVSLGNSHVKYVSTAGYQDGDYVWY